MTVLSTLPSIKKCTIFFLVYTANVANIYELIFFLQTDISFICVVDSEERMHVWCEDQMFMLEIC